ncbi:hypothetical protein CcaverHIS002_0504120 [Cutaneotrichosporon cavernicola]|uniref:Enoyl reductase (ER) domain-containing protein n=1 Tax=Cutaneotrichosporon cavernicola TaxID=279322 RepID=A0AA48L6E4_9TREE|nr:uncharacterized protein CcaverHIS019_0504670 [Cutaneotrichosporon cavernicola]BEI85011.1 hypothetical protein CcaverHIS002_0504120 [Cutaneotrichosporon cavernicola]BEI92839.1 hypothetical protein CcaverHIS019_0504670 [Cutaneotrichosporon cavernicola]BEJ00615.1 hypothetical protein CcaverHIS631_0504720 [Cutaneotrichosporon cavernicola]BEJ08382.1 hypothetical protein CcaverHIS641_0504670 [Cutaneotrichosporon cavernicola]
MTDFHHLVKTNPAQVVALDLPPNLSTVLLKKHTISVEPRPLPVLQPDGVLVRVIASGICGSDLHNFSAGGVGGRPVLEPLVMGHESAGEVIAVGDMVTTHKVGDRVAIEPGLPCRRCANCKIGRINICLNARYCGAPGSVGSLSKFFALPADMAPHLPDGLSWEEAGSVQPLAVGVAIGIRADIRAHQTVAVIGCGPIGLIAAAVCRAYGVSQIVGFDINPKRVAFAQGYVSGGAQVFDSVFLVDDLPTQANGTANGHDEHPVGDIKFEAAKIRAAKYLAKAGLDADGVDRVIEASGAEDAGLLGIAIARQGATYLAVGLGHHQTMTFPTLAVTNKEIDVKGITRYTSPCFPHALDLLRRGAVDLKPLITRTFPLSQSQEAFEAVEGGNEIKVIIMNQET